MRQLWRGNNKRRTIKTNSTLGSGIYFSISAPQSYNFCQYPSSQTWDWNFLLLSLFQFVVWLFKTINPTTWLSKGIPAVPWERQAAFPQPPTELYLRGRLQRHPSCVYLVLWAPLWLWGGCRSCPSPCTVTGMSQRSPCFTTAHTWHDTSSAESSKQLYRLLRNAPAALIPRAAVLRLRCWLWIPALLPVQILAPNFSRQRPLLTHSGEAPHWHRVPPQFVIRIKPADYTSCHFLKADEN